MNLLLDIGNTRIKWACWRQGCLEPSEARSHEAFFAALEAGSLLRHSPSRVLVACVGNDGLRARLQRAVTRAWGVSCEMFLAEAELDGVHNAYTEPARLGIDRWLAILAAHRRLGRAVVVVDAGSALTLDLVNAEGRHIGGLIVPGLRMMQNSLFNGTGQVRFPLERVCLPAGEQAWGRDTEQAVKYGALWSAVGLIGGMRSRARLMLGVEPACILTGGDAAVLQAYLEGSHELLPDLVLEGLAIQGRLELRR